MPRSSTGVVRTWPRTKSRGWSSSPTRCRSPEPARFFGASCRSANTPMKALLSRQPGGPETLTLEDIPEPAPAAGQVRVAVRACGVNYPDVLVIQDLYQFKPPRPFSPGAEVAGVVDAVGPGVDFRPGERVLLSPARNGMAEKTVGEARNCWRIPDSMPFDEAAAFMMTYATSYHALKDRARLEAGETLLVLGA